FGQRFARYALAGLLAVLPLVLTVAIVIWVARFIEGFIGPNTALGRGLQSVGLRFSDNTALAYAIGWVAVLAVVVTVGIAVEMGAKRLVQRMIDGAFQRIPLINNVYSTSKQLVDLFDKRPDADMKAMSVVFCYFAEQGGPS